NNPWVWEESDSIYYCYFDVDELTDDIFDKGVKQAFMYYSLEGVDTQSPLPFSDFYLDGGIKMEEHFTVEWQPGRIIFIMKPDDRKRLNPHRSSYEFLVQFLW
ncbi:hypothetical protein, partial [Candidatus Symbiothrix dinenymphae]|uniref:hypothetical protein n=1 Tax=Candidatus Symbiothrix dinenymphae TaxID=467085 RepID=UPI000A6C507F